MDYGAPNAARLAARVLLLDDADRILLLRAQSPDNGHSFWIMPGGGLNAGEGFDAAACRETYEETGIAVTAGPCVWTRRHVYLWNGVRHAQYERYFVARTKDSCVKPKCPDSYITDHRWWALIELRNSTEEFAPRRLAHLLPAILRGQYPQTPVDCGV